MGTAQGKRGSAVSSQLVQDGSGTTAEECHAGREIRAASDRLCTAWGIVSADRYGRRRSWFRYGFRAATARGSRTGGGSALRGIAAGIHGDAPQAMIRARLYRDAV